MRRARYEKLVTWQRSMDLVAFVYRLVRAFPDAEKSGLTSSMKKTASSIPGKIAEAAEARDIEGAIRALESAQSALVDLFNQALIARRVKVMRRGVLARLRARCRKMDGTLERELEHLDELLEASQDADVYDFEGRPGEGDEDRGGLRDAA